MNSLSAGPRALGGVSFLFRTGMACLSAAMVLAATAPAKAQNKFWVNSAGGSFPTAASWSTVAGGAGGAGAPAAGETANFTLGNTYTVGLANSVTNAALNVTNGNVTLDMNAFQYTLTGSVAATIGSISSQTSRLIVKDGILGVDTAGDDIAIGTALAATGFLTVSSGGRLGNGVLDPDIVVGSVGTGTLTLEDNGRADLAQVNIGQNEGSTGTIALTSVNSFLDVSGPLVVALLGTGNLNLSGSSTMNTASTVTIGSWLGGRGTVTVAGSGTTWTGSGALTIGDFGDAGLSIQSTSVVNTNAAVNVGNSSTGTGAAVVTGTDTTWNVNSTLNLGVSGTGNMAATAGGRINTTGQTVMAVNAGSESTVLITGAGSRWNSAGLTIGAGGTGNFSITAGGVTNTTGNVTLANTAASTGKATISGTGSAWNVTGALTVANLGTGTLTVESGGSLTTTGALNILDPAGTPNGTFNFQGGTVSVGSFSRSATSTFNWTDGTFLVNAGAFNNGGVNLTVNGADGDDVPVLRLSSGAQSTAANMPNLIVGSTRQGAVIVSGGSSLQTTNASIGAQDGSTGTLLVEGANSAFSVSGDLNLGGTATTGGGIGTLTVGNSSTVLVTNALRLWNAALVNMNGGTLFFSSLVPNGGRFSFTAGTVRVTSAFAANAAALDAILGPTHVLGAGRRIDVPNHTLFVQSDLSVEGGALSGNSLNVAAGINTRVSSGGNLTFTNGITNVAGARMFATDATISAGTTFTNNGELTLGGTTATVNANTLANTGLLAGAGRINNIVTNSSVGQIRVAAGQRLEILGTTGTNTNDGLIDVNGGTIEFARPVTNSTVSPSTGMIAARDATLRFSGGLQNQGSLTFTAGVSDVFGDVTTLPTGGFTTPGRVVVTGGAQANFFDDVVNNGTIQVSAAGSLQSTAVFLGSLSGNGVAGSGHVFMEGDMRPGFSPGIMAFGGDLTYGPFAGLDIEIAGLTAGTQYDRVTVADEATLAGTLDVSLLGGFKPAVGNSFAILTAASVVGNFDNVVLPQLNGGLQWGLSYLPQSVTLNVGGVLGDYNLDGTVDTSDYVVWRNLLSSNMIVADGSGNGIVDQADFNVWRTNFGKVAASAGGAGISTGSQSLAVPEPSAAVLAGLFAVISIAVTRRPRNG